MFRKLTTLTIGLNYGAPAGEALKGKAIPLDKALWAIHEAMKAHHIDCYTIIEATGYWQGQPERSLRVEVNHNDLSGATVKAAAQIKLELLQEAVLWVETHAQGHLV